MTSSSPPPPPTGLLYKVDGESLNTLIEKYEQSLSTNTDENEKTEKHRQEYTTLKSKLTTLPNHLEYDALVPLGRRALCPGKIIHTNEIMCLLGDNWFVECSALKAIDIVNHRIAKLDEQLEGLRKERDLINNWKQEAERQLVETIGEGTVEIREDYHEEHEMHWREKHRENVRRYHHQLAKQRLEVKQEKYQSDGELWSRLEELELQEELDNYLEQENLSDKQLERIEESFSAVETRSSKVPSKQSRVKNNQELERAKSPPVKPTEEKTESKPSNPPTQPPVAIRKRVKFSADNIIHDISNDTNFETQISQNQEKSTSFNVGFIDDSAPSYPCFDPIIIRFRHSSSAEILSDHEHDASGTEEDHNSQIVTNPGSIVNVFGPTSISAISNKPLPKSILKPYVPPLVTDTRSKKRKEQMKPSFGSDDEVNDTETETVSAISKVVTERLPVFTNLQLNNPTERNNDPDTNANKPLSLFKMRRQQTLGVVVTSTE